MKELENRNLLRVKDFTISDLYTFENEIKEELKSIKYNDPEVMVKRMELPYNEKIDLLDIKYNAASYSGYTIPPGIYGHSDLKLMLKSLFSNCKSKYYK